MLGVHLMQCGVRTASAGEHRRGQTDPGQVGSSWQVGEVLAEAHADHEDALAGLDAGESDHSLVGGVRHQRRPGG